MKRILFLLCCLFTLSLYGQDTTNINKTDASGRKQGVWKKYEKGKLVYEGQFKDNVPYGTFRYYHTNGKLKSTTDFIQGVHKVNTVIYHENGRKASEGVFIDQQKDGVWNYYANNGQLISVEEYVKGKRSGTWKVYAKETGVLLEEIEYKDDKMNGTYKTYFTDGQISLEEHFLDGKRNGLSTSYFPKGKICVQGNYLKDVRTGPWDTYDASGKLRSTIEYKDHRMMKTYIYLYQNGYGQKVNQDLIAYFLKDGDKAVAVSRNGKRIKMDESLDDIANWADFLVFTRIAPSVIAATDAIVGYKDVEGADNDAIIIKLKPSPGEEIYSEGVEAKMVKALFNKEKPQE